MKITRIMIFGILIMMLIMQLSCATSKEDQANKDLSTVTGQAQAETVTSVAVKETAQASTEVKETAQADTKSTETEETPAVAGLLADTHKTAGVECSDCHQETPPANEVPTTICMTCHEDYKDVALSAIDPHNAHVEFTNCGDCHHSHRESENQCMSCHSFNLKTP